MSPLDSQTVFLEAKSRLEHRESSVCVGGTEITVCRGGDSGCQEGARTEKAPGLAEFQVCTR
jgi:hypothetical protein